MNAAPAAVPAEAPATGGPAAVPVVMTTGDPTAAVVAPAAAAAPAPAAAATPGTTAAVPAIMTTGDPTAAVVAPATGDSTAAPATVVAPEAASAAPGMVAAAMTTTADPADPSTGNPAEPPKTEAKPPDPSKTPARPVDITKLDDNVKNNIQIYGVVYTEKGKFGDFEWMVNNGYRDNTLYIFNDNTEDHNTNKKGSGNGVMRQYNKHRKINNNSIDSDDENRNYSERPLSAGLSTGIFTTFEAEAKNIILQEYNEIITILNDNNKDDKTKYKYIICIK